MSDAVHDLLDEFASKIRLVVEEEFADRISSVIGTPLGVTRTRRSGPGQLCPFPGCANKAAPIFGMVCRDHKDVPKDEILKYREARKAGAAEPAERPQGSIALTPMPGPANEPIAPPAQAVAAAGAPVAPRVSSSPRRRVPVK